MTSSGYWVVVGTTHIFTLFITNYVQVGTKLQ